MVREVATILKNYTLKDDNNPYCQHSQGTGIKLVGGTDIKLARVSGSS